MAVAFLLLCFIAQSMAAETTTETTTVKPRICDPGGSGQFMPLGGKAEEQWDNRFKVFLYGAGLLYSFVGVSIVADIFMSAIERVTSKKKRVLIPETDRIVTTNMWNETVANLTLMALGSSAPEILLAVNDVLKRQFFAGEMGPSTIVGSAAFNLFVIIAVCINAIPAGETREIKETQVFFITAAWSIFAYLWLLVIVQFWSLPVITVFEGAITVVFFPILVVMSYASDVGWLTKDNILAFLWQMCMMLKPDDGEDGEEASPIRQVCQMLCKCCKFLCMPVVWIFMKLFRCMVCILCAIFCCCGCCRRKRKHEEGEEEAEEGAGEDEEHIGEEFDEHDDEAPILDEDGEPIDCEEGVLTFRTEVMEVSVGMEEKELAIPVIRKNGAEGRISVQYRTEGLSATPGYDFEEIEGQLDFKSGVTNGEINLTILPKAKGECDDVLQVILEDPDGGAMLNPDTDGGEDACLLTIKLKNENGSARGCRAVIFKSFDKLLNVDEIWLGTETWKGQVIECIYVNGSPEDQAEANWVDWVMHVLFLPWKMFYALMTPPPVYLGGWICFVVALMHIGLLTSIIGDIAELFGCVGGIPDNITAITFVALGTSLPDTFASKTAATQDEWADASIVNVTGSNSVNVFLGIGVPWCMAAIYWKLVGVNDEWEAKYGELHLAKYPDGGFVVEGYESLGYSVIVFTCGALVCLVVIRVRRNVYGGELGGPPDMKATSSFLLVMLWVSYIGLQIWKSGAGEHASTVAQVVSILIMIPVLIFMMIIFLILLQILKWSKKYIGEEGFWGIFIAVCLIGARMIVFAMFQTK